MAKKPQRILVCRTDAIGDAVLTLPVCQILKKKQPAVNITMLVSKYAQQAIDGQPGVDQTIVYDKDNLHSGKRGLKKLTEQIKAARFDSVLVVFPDKRISWAVFRAGIKTRIGSGRRWWSLLFNQRIGHSRSSGGRHEADFNLDFLRALGYDVQLEAPKMVAEPEALEWAKKFLEKKKVDRAKALVVIHPGGRGSSANWTRMAYAQLVKQLKTLASVEVLLTGTPQEYEALIEVERISGTTVLKLDEALTLKQFIALINKTSVFVSGNTGPMHIAAALGTSLVALFPPEGVTGPERWRPLGVSTFVFTAPTLTQEITNEAIDPIQVAEEVKKFLNL